MKNRKVSDDGVSPRSSNTDLASIVQRTLTAIRSADYLSLAFLLGVLLLALSLRASLTPFKSIDFLHYTKGWYNTIKSHGFEAFRYPFYNYNPPYLYALYFLIRFFPDVPAVTLTKIPSILSDFLCAGLIYKIVRLKFTAGPVPFFAGAAFLFAPSVVLNSAMWGQADSLYTTLLVACIYFLVMRRNIPAFLAFGVALAFKLQAVFLAPLLLVLLLRKWVSWKHFMLVPPVLFLALVPAWLAGRPIQDLATIYFSQAAFYDDLTLNAPTLYAAIPAPHPMFDLFYPAGLILTASVLFLFVSLVRFSRKDLNPSRVVELALASLLLMPFFLPRMHDRYFFPADVVSIVFAFFHPSYFYIALAVNGLSFLAYQPFLFQRELVPMPVLSLGMFIVICIIIRSTLLDFYRPRPAENQKG